MSLYHSGIRFLPRPPRAVFSIGNESTRATLPDFATVAELSEFTNRLFNYHLGIQSIGTQALITSCFIFYAVIGIGLVLAKRIYEGKFWLIRVIKKSSGVIVVPNPIVAFLLMAGAFAIIFFPFFMVLCRRLAQELNPSLNIILWFTLPWLLLVYGVVWATIGTYFATPASLPSSTADYEQDEGEGASISWSIKHILGRASVVNAMTLLIPVALTTAIAIPSFIGFSIWERALRMEKQWQVKYSMLPNFTQEMVQGTQSIWYTQLRAARFGTIVFIIYTVIAFVMTAVYIPVALRLIVDVREDIERIRDQLDAAETVRQEEPPPAIRASKITLDALRANRGRLEGKAIKSVITSQDRQITSPSSPSTTTAPIVTTTTSINSRNYATTRKQTEDLLQSALRHIYIQALAIGLGTAGFGGISLAFSVTLYGKLEQPSGQGGTLLEHHVGPIWLALMYACCQFGGISVFAVVFKTYEPVFTSKVFHRRHADTQIRFKDIIKGLAHIRSTFFDSRNSNGDKQQVSNYTSFEQKPQAKIIRRSRGASTSSYYSIVEAASSRNEGHRRTSSGIDHNASKEVKHAWGITAKEMEWTVDSSIGSTSSPSSVIKHL